MRGVASICMIVAASVALCSCIRDPFVTEEGETRIRDWWIPQQVDRVTGTALPSAYVFAEASNSNVEYPRVSSLMLTCMPGNRPLIRFAFDFKIGSLLNTTLGYRFDDLPGHETVPSRVVRGNQIIVIEEPDAVALFVSELEKAETLYVRIRSINGGRTSVEYPVKGAWGAVRVAFVNCAMPAPPLRDAGRARLPGIY